jgi:signal transduction histidine kinase
MTTTDPAAPTAPRGPRVPARWRIAGWILLTTGLTLLALLLTMRSLLTNDVERAANQAVTQEIDEFITFTQQGVDPRTGEPFSDLAALFEVYLSRQHPDRGEALIGIAGERVLHSDNIGPRLPDGDRYLLAGDRKTLDRMLDTGAASGVLDTAQGQVRWGKVAVGADGGEPGTLIVAEFVAPDMAETTRLLTMTLLVALGGLLLTAGISYVVAGQILAPVRAIARAASRISESDLGVRVPVHSRDELGELAQSFNGMLDRIEDAYNAQRRFVDDASHELRTPITVIRGHLELLEDDPDDRAATLKVVDGELARMSRIVTDLLMLAKAQRPDFLVRRETDLAGMMLGIESTIQALDDRPWLLMQVAEGRAEVDAQRLTQVLLQYATNAVQYAPAGTPVRFGSALVPDEDRDGDVMLRLWLADQGPGIAPDDIERVFDRFHRAAGDAAHGGFGLGLSIVRAIAEAHGGQAWVESALGQGATFGVDIPIELLPEPDTDEQDTREWISARGWSE